MHVLGLDLFVVLTETNNTCTVSLKCAHALTGILDQDFILPSFLNLVSPYITSCHTFFSLTTIMGFIRIWENCSWIWFCEGFLWQFLAKKGEKGVKEYCYGLTLSSLQQLLKILITKTCHKFSRNSNGVNFFVTCDLSYEHSCDLCSELQGRYYGHSLKVL